MTVPCLTDDFNRADNTSSLGVATTGETWTLQSTAPYDAQGNPITAASSILGILSNQAYSSDTRITGTHSEPCYANIGTLDCGFANLDASLDIVFPYSQGSGGGLAFRWSDATHFWLAFIYCQITTGTYFLIIRKHTGSGASFSSPIVTSVLAAGTTGTHTLRVKTCRNRIQAFIDGVQQADFTDAFNQTATKHGIVTYNSTTTKLDNLSICPSYCGGWGRRRFGGPGF